MSEQVAEKRTQPFIIDLMTLYLPAKDPYLTAKWYVDVFGFDPHASRHSPLQPNTDLVVLHTVSGLTLFFIQSDDKHSMSFTNKDGHNHAVLLFRVKDSELEEIYARMKEYGVQIVSDGIKDRGGCGREITFYDPDGRKVELNTFGT